MTTIPLPITLAPPPPVQGDTPANSPLSHSHLTALELANQRAKKIRRAVAVATCDAYLSAIFAGLTLLSAILDPTSLVLGAALAIIAFNSFRGIQRFRKFDLTAPRFLALNQLALSAILILYAVYSLYLAAHANSALASTSSDPELAKALGGYSLAQLYWLLALAVYGGLIVGTLLAQGFAALYYFSRKKHLAAYLAATPDWILQLQKTQAGG